MDGHPPPTPPPHVAARYTMKRDTGVVDHVTAHSFPQVKQARLCLLGSFSLQYKDAFMLMPQAAEDAGNSVWWVTSAGQ